MQAVRIAREQPRHRAEIEDTSRASDAQPDQNDSHRDTFSYAGVTILHHHFFFVPHCYQLLAPVLRRQVLVCFLRASTATPDGNSGQMGFGVSRRNLHKRHLKVVRVNTSSADLQLTLLDGELQSPSRLPLLIKLLLPEGRVHQFARRKHQLHPFNFGSARSLRVYHGGGIAGRTHVRTLWKVCSGSLCCVILRPQRTRATSAHNGLP